MNCQNSMYHLDESSTLTLVRLHALRRGISDTSLRLWSEVGWDNKGHKDGTCGDALHTVWPQSCHRSHSELLARLKFKNSSLPKVTGFHRICSSITHLETEIHLTRFITTNRILSLNYEVVSLQLLHGVKGGRENETFLQSFYHDTFLLQMFSFKPFVICITFCFLLLKFVQLFLWNIF